MSFKASLQNQPSDLSRRLSDVVKSGRLKELVNAQSLSEAANDERLSEVASPPPAKSRLKLFCRWFSTESRQLIRIKLMSSTALNWISYSSYAGIERLRQIQIAWFDTGPTVQIKLDPFVDQKKKLLLPQWFQ